MDDREVPREQLLLEVSRLRQRVTQHETLAAELDESNKRLLAELEECRRVEGEVRRRLDAANVLQRVSELVASASDMSEALQRVCSELARLLGVTQAGFALLSPDRSSAEVIADVHPPQSPSAIGTIIPVADNPPLAHVLDHGAPLVVSETPVDAQPGPIQGVLRQRNVQSILILPVMADGAVVGTMGFEAVEPRVFGESDVQLVQHVANQVGQLLVRKRAERARLESESRLSGILSSMIDFVYAFDKEGRFVLYPFLDKDDPHAESSSSEGTKHSGAVPSELRELFHQAVEENREGRAAHYEYWTGIDGQPRWYSVSFSPYFLEGEFRGSVAVARDITERRRAEEAVHRANRGLRMLSKCNEAVSRARQESELFHMVCQIVVEIGGYVGAWVGTPEQDEAKTVRPVAQAGLDEEYLDQLGITWADNEGGRGPTGKAIRTRKPSIARDVLTDPGFIPWRDSAAQRGFFSSIALPLMDNGQCLGALNIYASEPDAFDREEVTLLTELADNMAYGLAALRARSERAWMEEVLQRYAERLEMLQELDRAILEAQSAETIARATLARIGQLMPCRQASILAFGPENVPRTLATHVNEDHSLSEGGPQERALAAQRVEAHDAGSSLGIPLMAQGELVGVLRLTSASQDAFSPEHIEIAYEVAAPLAVAIQHARLNEQLRVYAGSLEETVAQRTRELKTERDRTQAILESLGEAVIVADAQGTILYTNPATTTLTGFEGEELLGQSWGMLQGNGQVDEAFTIAENALSTGQAWRSEAMGWRKDATGYDAAVTVTPLFDPDHPGQFVGSVWVQRDITPLKEAERLKDQFISNVSHELRTPLSILTLLVGNLDRLYDRLEEAKRKEMIQDVREQIGVLSDLVGDVLEISRIDSERVSFEREEVNLTQLVREEMAKQQPLASRKKQRMEMMGITSLALQGNEGQLRQIVRNILNNAIKFTPAGGKIACTCRRGSGERGWGSDWPGSDELPPGQWAAFRVADDGIGIRSEDMAHLFERFYRVETQVGVPGTGLGLAITRELVDLHGGQIGVESTLGEGSVFAVYLPCAEEG